MYISDKKVCVGMATYPERGASAAKAIESLIGQSAKVCIYLNGYTELPDWARALQSEGVTFMLGISSYGNLGDAGKFFFFESSNADYYLTADDDIVYPNNYVSTMTHWIDYYDTNAVVCVHGRFLGDDRFPIKGYFKNYHPMTKLHHFLNKLDSPTRVHVAGTGCTGFHQSKSDIIPYKDLLFGTPNQADIHFAVQCIKTNTPVYAIPRQKQWLKALEYSETSIYDQSRDADTPSTMLNAALVDMEIPK